MVSTAHHRSEVQLRSVVDTSIACLSITLPVSYHSPTLTPLLLLLHPASPNPSHMSTHIRPKIRIHILLQLLPRLLFRLYKIPLQPDIVQRVLVRRIDIRLGRDELDLHVFAHALDRAQVGRGVIGALGAPGEVVQIAVGVDGEDVDVGRGEEEVLDET